MLALAVCAALGGAGPAWAACTAAPSGATISNGFLVPASGDTVSCTGLTEVAIVNIAATGATVDVAAGGDVRSTTLQAPAVALGEGATITNAGVLFADRPGLGGTTALVNNGGTVTIRGAGNRITNSGTIEARDGIAIQGRLSGSPVAAGVILNNSGVIRSTNDTASSPASAVSLGDGAQVTNSGGTIEMRGGGQREALAVGVGSTINNQATGVIRATETRTWATINNAVLQGVTGVRMESNSTLVNAGRIEANAAVSGVGDAVYVNGTGSSIVNSGTIDASTAQYAIRMEASVNATGSFSITNSGTLLGGSRGAILIGKGNGAVVTLDTGSQITGSVTVRDALRVPLSDAELGGDQAVIDYCRQNPADSLCFKTVEGLPAQATLRLQGTGSENDRISGFNRIERRGPGTWTLNTPLQAGSASDGYQSGDFRGPLTVEVQDAAGQLNLTGAISDNADGTKGELVKDGAGLLALSGNNTYSGPTRIDAGTLQANGGNGIGDNSAVTVAAGATLALGGTETIGSLAGAGNVSLQNNALRTGNDNTSTTFSGAINDNGGLVKIGTGTLRLSGNSPSTGILAVAGGILDMAGTTAMRAGTTPAGTLIGTGTMGNLVNQGRVAPGNSVGTLTVTGNYTQTASGTLDIEVKPDGSGNDRLAVGGSATLAGTLTASGENGALLTPAAGGAAGSPKLYTILTAGGGVSGQFGTTPAPLGAFTFDTLYNPNDVQLGVTYAGFTAVQAPAVIPGTGTTNQVSKAAGLDRVPIDPGAGTYTSGNADFDRVLLEIANETADQLADTFNAIIAEPYAAFNTVLLEQNDFYAETVLDRAQVCSVRGRSSLGGDFLPERRTSDGTAVAGCGAAAGHRPHGAWLDATWLKGEVDGEDGLSGYDYRLAGAVLGGDTALSDDAAVGLAVGFGQPKLDSYDLADAEIDGDSWFVSGYGTVTRDRWEFAGLLGYTWGSYESTRRIRFGSIDRTAQGDFDGDGFIASAKAAYFYQVDGVDVVPEFGLTYSKIWQDGFTETGADSLNLKVEDAGAHSLVTSIGVRVGTEVQSASMRIRPQALLRYEYDWNADDDDAHEVRSSFAAVPVIGSIDIIGQNRGEHGLTAGAGATVQVAENVDLFAGAGYRWNSNGDEYSFGAGARMAW